MLITRLNDGAKSKLSLFSCRLNLLKQQTPRRGRQWCKEGGGDVALVCENAPLGAPDKP
jgi:hypothetical protein